MTAPVEMLTAREVAQRYNVALHAVRRWIAGGQLKVVMCGRKALVADENVRVFLLNGDKQTCQEPSAAGQIRQVKP